MTSKILGVMLSGLLATIMASGCEGAGSDDLGADINAAELRGGNGKAQNDACKCKADADATGDEDADADETREDGGVGGRGKDAHAQKGKSGEAKARHDADGGIDCDCTDASEDGGVGHGKSGDKGQSDAAHGKPDAGSARPASTHGQGDAHGQGAVHGKGRS